MSDRKAFKEDFKAGIGLVFLRWRFNTRKKSMALASAHLGTLTEPVLPAQVPRN
jgi:hypothetical protein